MALLATSILPDLNVRRMENGPWRVEPELSFHTAPQDCCIGIHADVVP
jgi:hypothetical protein